MTKTPARRSIRGRNVAMLPLSAFLAATLASEPALAQMKTAASPGSTSAPEEQGPSLPKRTLELQIRGGYHLTTGNESTGGTKKVSTGTPSLAGGNPENPVTGGPAAGTTKSSGASEDSFQRKQGTNPTANTDTTKSTSTSSKEAKTAVTDASTELGGGSGLSVGGTLNLWLTQRFGLSTSVDAHWNSSSAQIAPGGTPGVGVPTPGTINLTESYKTTVTVSSPSAAVDVGPNTVKTDMSASGTHTTTVWSWGGTTFTARDDVGLAVFKERLGDARGVSTPSVTGDLRPGAGSTGFNASRDETLPLSPGPTKVAASYLQVSGTALSYRPSFSVPTMRGTDGSAGGAGGSSIVYNGADNAGGIASGSVAAPSSRLGDLFPAGGVVLLNLPNTKLMPSEGIRGEATGSVATALGAEAEYRATGKAFASTGRDAFATLSSLMGRVIAWATNRTEIWVGGGLAMATVGEKEVTTIKVAGDGGSGPATQTVTFKQNDPAEKDPAGTLGNRVTSFKETSEIETNQTSTTDSSSLLMGPMLGIGGRVALLEGLVAHWSLGYSPILGGKRTTYSRTDTTGKIKSVFEATVKTLEATGSAGPILSTSTTTTTDEQTIDTRNNLDKDSAGTTTVGIGGSAVEAVLGLTYNLGAVTVGIEGRDQNVSGINTIAANASVGIAF